MATMMKCGHAANSTTTIEGEKRPACAICAGISGGANLIVDEVGPDLSKRQARCGYATSSRCEGTIIPSEQARDKQAFFEYRPDREFDSFYCGCFGWN